MCIKTMIKVALGAAIVCCTVGVAKQVVCMISHIQNKSQDIDSLFQQA